MCSFPVTSARGQQMLGYLPGYYETSRVMRSIMQSSGAEMDALRQALDEIAEQFFVRTATWGLDLWEKELGLFTDASKPIGQRRSVIESKLRGVGSVTVKLIQNVAEAYDRGAVEVTAQPEMYRFTVRFVDTLGTPPNLDDLKAAIEEIKPAHLAVEYVFRYFIFDELDSISISFDYLDELGLTWGQLHLYSRNNMNVEV
ncbi:YmfQ family protein [Paenibacillus thalictri]|uniref:DUF2313 domain-containing protein n=1 Tax=Paenibacillus thalictri TaxID=2527873 RepID=A0A4Q9DHH0_9BACL|nr:YmfQ family protein [Paenibacillus thalictri]TBL71366.1 DUF2313 domain-containing protein [Paenibacillus thalictri]